MGKLRTNMNIKGWSLLLSPVVIIMLAVSFFAINTNERLSMPWHENSSGATHELIVYKSATCGCCDIHADYLIAQGYRVEKVDTENMEEIKDRYSVPRELWSCHTTIVNGGEYFIEGHIPVEAIEELLESEPEIAGIGMPGMPSGSPGMPGPKYEPFEIMQVDEDGNVSRFMSI